LSILNFTRFGFSKGIDPSDLQSIDSARILPLRMGFKSITALWLLFETPDVGTLIRRGDF